MTEQSPSLLSPFRAEPAESNPVVLPAVSPSTGRNMRAMTKRPQRSGQWLAASDRWMNRSFDPAEAEAIRESYRSVPAVDQDDED